jgi:hypothetical protein
MGLFRPSILWSNVGHLPGSRASGMEAEHSPGPNLFVFIWLRNLLCCWTAILNWALDFSLYYYYYYYYFPAPNLLYSGYRELFPVGKAAGAWSWLLTSNWCRGQENVDLYIHSPIRLHGVVLNLLSTGTTLPLTYFPRSAACLLLLLLLLLVVVVVVVFHSSSHSWCSI